MTDNTPPDQTPDPSAVRRSRVSFLAMVAVAFVPLFAAYIFFFYFPDLVPRSTTNEGHLVSPPISAETLGLPAEEAIPTGKWTLIVVAAYECDDACRESLYLTRQVNIALGKDSTRLQRALLADESAMTPDLQALITAEYPNLMVHGLDVSAYSASIEGVTSISSLDGYMFLADPNGNVMMYYTPAHEGKQLISDLKHLLRLSNIG